MSTTCNLILTVIFLRLFHHGPSPVPWKLRHIVFGIIAPLILFDVKEDGNPENVSQVAPNAQEHQQKNVKLDSTDPKEKPSMESLLELLNSLKQPERNKDEMFIKEWQTIAKILDRLLLILNMLSMTIAFGYGYTKLYTY